MSHVLRTPYAASGIAASDRDYKSSVSHRRRKSLSPGLQVLLSLVVLFFSASLCFADVKEWTNGGATGVWSDSSNWSPGGAPTSADTVLLNATSSDDCTLDLDPSVQAIIINASYSGTFHCSSHTLTLTKAFKALGTSSFDAGSSTIDIQSSVGVFEIASMQPLYNMTITNANTVRYNNGAVFGNLQVANDLHLIAVNTLGCGFACTKHISVQGNILSDDADGWNGAGSVSLYGSANQQLNGSGELTQLLVEKSAGLVSLSSFSGSFGQLSGGYLRLASTNVSTLNLGGGSFNAYVFDFQGGTVAGTGTLNGDVYCSGSSILSPGGTGTGCITVNGALIMQSGSSLRVDILGTSPCSLYDQVVVNGDVELNNPTLISGTTVQTASALTIISNDGTDAITGQFDGVNDGSNLTLSGTAYIASYTASGDNDFVLTTNNQAPVAMCGWIFKTISSACAPANVNPSELDAGSYDPEGSPLTYSMNPSGPFVAGFYFVDLTVSDTLGASSTCQGIIEVVDMVPPVIVTPCPANITVCGEQNVTWVEPVAVEADNCTVYTYRTSNPGDYFSLGTTTVLYQFEDLMGNNRYCTFDITVLPLPDVSINQSQIPGACQGAQLLSAFVANESTLVGPLHYMWTGPLNSNTQTIQATLNGTYMVTVTDAADCYSTASVTLSVDTQAPVPTLSSLPDLHGQCSLTITNAPTASDECAGMINGTTSDALTYSAPGTYQINWTYTDANGNSATQAQTVIIADTIAPVPTASSLPTVYGQCSATVVSVPTASDNCSGLISGTTNQSLTFSTQGTHTITWVYNDAAGNSSSQTQLVIVQDTIAPVPTLTSLPTLSAQCAINVTTVPTASDACNGLVQGATSDPLSYTSVGSHTITWHYSDASGNSRTQQQTVVVTDNLAPVPTQSSLPTIVAQCGTTVTSIPTASDNCAGLISATTNSPLSYSTLGTRTIVWTYNDGHGNTSTQNQIVQIVDTQAPVPSQSSLPTLTAQCSLVVTNRPTAVDNCAGTIQATTTSSLNFNAQGSYTITWVYNDGHGNQSTQTQSVVIQDNTAPVPTQSSLPTLSGQCGVTVSTRPTALDNCSGLIQGTTTNALSYNSQGSFVITWRYVDARGNVSTQTQNVVINDNTPPTPNVASLPTITSSCYAYVTSRPYATDNCGGCNNSGTSIRATTSSPTYYNTAGTYTIVWVYTDAQGNSTTQNQTVVVVDNSAPVPNQSSLATINRQCNYTVGYPYPSASDNCKGNVAGSPSQTYFASQGTHTLVWTYNDGNGNITTQNQTIIIQDTTRPTISCRGTSNASALSVGLNSNGQLSLNSSMASSMVYFASDNCGGTPTLSIVSGQTSFDCSNVGQLFAIGLKATDAVGNTASCTCIIRITPGSGNDDDCDGVPNACDEAAGGNDAVDNNNDGLPDCKYPPAYADIKSSWKCGTNKVWVWYRNNSSHTPTCIQYSALQALINSNQVWLGGASYCCNAKVPGQDQDIPYGVWQSDESDRLFVYPNPATNKLSVMLVGIEHQPKTLRIVDLLGTIVYTSTLSNDQSEVSLDLDALSIINGSYTVQIESAGSVLSTQLIVVR